MPVGGCFRLVFFFSFLGRMVSELCFVFRLALTLGPAGFRPKETRGIESTSSSSTVMCFDDVSPVVWPLLNFKVVLDWRLWSDGVGATELDRRVFSFTLPLSLPLSLVAPFFLWMAGSDLEAASLAREACESLSMAISRLGPGVLGWLTSWTVSSDDDVPLGPGAGVLIPEGSWAYSSPSVSDGACDEGSDERGWGEGVDRWMLITGVSGSCLRSSWG